MLKNYASMGSGQYDNGRREGVAPATVRPSFLQLFPARGFPTWFVEGNNCGPAQLSARHSSRSDNPPKKRAQSESAWKDEVVLPPVHEADSEDSIAEPLNHPRACAPAFRKLHGGEHTPNSKISDPLARRRITVIVVRLPTEREQNEMLCASVSGITGRFSWWIEK